MNALKEWATVVNALENGDQTVLLRKGGILEDSSGFIVESEKFFLFPTFEHQETRHLKPQFHKHLATSRCTEVGATDVVDHDLLAFVSRRCHGHNRLQCLKRWRGREQVRPHVPFDLSCGQS